MAKHVTNTCGQKRVESARHVQAGFLQGSITSTLLPGANIHSQTGVGLTLRKTTSYAIQLGGWSRTRPGMSVQESSNQGQRSL
jgi:hypothetical protein